jgi:hypothetical protein
MVSEANAFYLALIMHPIGTVMRTTLYNMVLILLSIIVATIAVAILMIHSSCGILAGSGIAKESSSITGEPAEQSSISSPAKQFSVVVLPDGKIVNPVVAARL